MRQERRRLEEARKGTAWRKWGIDTNELYRGTAWRVMYSSMDRSGPM
jgi:hypothetical protein